MLIIRRELPRTKNAGLVIETYCIKRMRVLLFVGPSTATSTAYLPSLSLGGVNGLAALISGSRRQGVVLVLRHYANGPDKTQEFPPDGGYDLGLVFPLAEQLSIAAMQSMLGFPGNLFHLWAEVGLSFQKIASQPRSELIGPGGFDHDASQMSVARLGDPGLDPAGAAGVFAGNQAAVTHELSGAEVSEVVLLNEPFEKTLCEIFRLLTWMSAPTYIHVALAALRRWLYRLTA
jgi:hypothetical protein